MIPRPVLLLTVATALLGSGCSVLSPKKDPTRFYELTGSNTSAPASSASGGTLVLNVQLAGYLQNTSLAQRLAPNQLTYLPFDQWAQPLGEGISQVLREDLSAGTGLAVVNANNTYVIRDATRVDVVIRQFDVLPSDRVQITAQWQVRTNLTGSPIKSGEFRQERPYAPNVKSLQDAVAVLSQLLGEVSQAIRKSLP
ncbi:MAG: membrane integrity-associated transporter subunit PqiC [Verrucomicrobia bacterium]|nr:membrane integrity-associated transporter subunit PqiC [Verrucomicrobiota bacterium]